MKLVSTFLATFGKRQPALKLHDFLDGLELEVQLTTATARQIEQLVPRSKRTAEFNLAGVQYSTSELHELVQSGRGECLVVEVSDRFGDDGVSGAVIFTVAEEQLAVESFYLSCRVLGRKVEYHVLRQLVQLARERNCSRLCLRYRQSDRNATAKTFVEAVAGPSLKAVENGFTAKIAVETIESLCREAFSTDSRTVDRTGERFQLSDFLARRMRLFTPPEQEKLLNEITTELQCARQIGESIRKQRRRTRSDATLDVLKPRTPTEDIIATIWCGVLNIDQVGIHDNFFELGGHSILMTQVLSRVAASFPVKLSLASFFEAPTVAGLARYIDRANQENNGLQVLPLHPVSRNGGAPLSFAQQQLWFLNQLEPDNPAYNIPAVIRLNGRLHVEALQQSLTEIVRRHEGLRATFTFGAGVPVQNIAPAESFTIPIVDLQELVEPAREDKAQQLGLAEARRCFDLSHGPLLRASLLRLAEDEHLMLLTMHHIVTDGWSFGVLAQELGSLYQNFRAGKPSLLPELSIQYVDFAHWQREWIQGEVIDPHLAYWKKQLAGIPRALELPTNHARPAILTSRGGTVQFELSSRLTEELRLLSRQEKVTLFMTLLGAFQTLLHYYTSQDDMLVGTPIASRNTSGVEGLIGLFVNTLVLRADLSGDPSFKELLVRVRETTLGGYTHQVLPFEKLVEELQPDRDMSHTPLFQVMFSLLPAINLNQELPDLKLTLSGNDAGVVKRDLTLMVQEIDDRLTASLQYSTDLFDSHTIIRMARHYENLLESVVKKRTLPLSTLHPLTTAEHQQLLLEWNDTNVDHDARLCLHQWLEAEVERRPDAIAVVFGDECLTYRELNCRANQLAHHLQSLGVGPEMLIGLYTDRSPEMVTGVWGILKTGAAYLPLDTTFPKERVKFMLEDGSVTVFLTQQHLLKDMPEERRPRVLCLDSDWEEIERESDQNLSSAAVPGNLAYVIYTSGSTGKAKGVLIEQQQLLNYTCDMIARLKVTSESSLAMVQPLTVDSCNTMLYPSLLAGGALHLISREHATDAPWLCEYFANHRISHLKIAPSHLSALHGAYSKKVMPEDCLIIGGESSHWDFVRSLQAVIPGPTIFNHYGPTEATVGCLAYRLQMQESKDQSTTVPLGRPLANTQAYVLDGHLRPVPAGVPGELHISGDGVARGYMNRAEKTAGSFIPDPFSAQPGMRMYKTGDVCRTLTDGRVEFLGRADDQVKIRGFRIEPREVESILGEHPAVREAAVITREVSQGDMRLIAYVVLAEQPVTTINELNSFLKEKVPDYMVPSSFITMEALPRTPHGKIDHQALPVSKGVSPELDAAFVPPQNEVEQTIATVWRMALQVERVGIHDNFFELGGNSLSMMRVHGQLRDRFKKEFPLIRMFKYPTINLLARYLSQDENERVSFEGNGDRGRKQQAALRRRVSGRRAMLPNV
jgi:amino acid adenylation domain-containing protein